MTFTKDEIVDAKKNKIDFLKSDINVPFEIGIVICNNIRKMELAWKPINIELRELEKKYSDDATADLSYNHGYREEYAMISSETVEVDIDMIPLSKLSDLNLSLENMNYICYMVDLNS